MGIGTPKASNRWRSSRRLYSYTRRRSSGDRARRKFTGEGISKGLAKKTDGPQSYQLVAIKQQALGGQSDDWRAAFQSNSKCNSHRKRNQSASQTRTYA